MAYFVLKMLQKSRMRKSREETELLKEFSVPEIKKLKSIRSSNYYVTRCRACLKKGKISLLKKSSSNIVEALKNICKVNIDCDDSSKTPKYICSSCYLLLKGCLKFCEMVQKSDKIINESIKETETSPIYNNVSDNYRFSESDEEYIKPEPCNKEDKESKCFENAESKNCIVESDEEYKEQTSKGKVRCKICNKEVTKYYIKNHLTLHGVGTKKEKVKVECKLCKKTLEKAYYKKHLEGVHGKPDHSNYVCYVCGKTFKYQSGYKSHVLSHGNEFPYKCQLCPYRGKHSALLKVHMRTHTRDYRFQCTDCPARFLTSGNLHKHMLKHKEKKFKCDSCAKAFHTKVEVERHFQSDHLGIKNHVCNICEKAFGYRSAMMKHQLHVHKRQKMLNGRMPSYLLEERKEQEDPSQPLSECFE